MPETTQVRQYYIHSAYRWGIRGFRLGQDISLTRTQAQAFVSSRKAKKRAALEVTNAYTHMKLRKVMESWTPTEFKSFIELIRDKL